MTTLRSAIDRLPSRDAFDRAQAEIDRVTDQDLRDKLQAKFDAQWNKAEAIRRGVEDRTAMEQEYANQREIGIIPKIKQRVGIGRGTMEREIVPNTLADYESLQGDNAARERASQINTRLGTAPLRGVMWGLDLLHRGVVRTPTAMLGGGYSAKEAWDMPAEEWAKKVVNVAENDDTARGTIARIGAGIPAAIGGAVGAAVGVPTIAAGALANVINGDIPSPEQSVENTRQAFKDTTRSGAELGVQILTDPLNLVSFGGTSKEALTALQAAGREAELGKYAGQSFLRVHPPFMSSFSKPVGTPYAFRDWFGKVTGQAGRDAIDAIATKGLQSEPIYNTALRDQMRLARRARGDEAIIRQEMADKIKSQVSALPEEFKTNLSDVGTRSDFYNKFAEYRDFERVKPAEQMDLFGSGTIGARPSIEQQMKAASALRSGDEIAAQEAISKAGVWRPKPKPEIEVGSNIYSTDGQGVIRKDVGESSTAPWQYEMKKTRDYGATYEPEQTSVPAPLPQFGARVVHAPDKTMSRALFLQRKLQEEAKEITKDIEPALRERTLREQMPNLDERLKEIADLKMKGGYHALQAGESYVPYEQLDETFGQGAQKFADVLKSHSNEWKDLLVERGYLTPDQAAVNPFSGIYLRRPMSSRYGIFDELAAKPGHGDPGAGYTALEKARVGAAEGFPGGMSNAELPSYVQVGQQSFIDRALGRAPQVDPFELISGYNRLGARAAAETTFRQKMAEQFGREVAAGDKSGKNLGASVVRVKQPDGTTVERVLDPEVANRMQQVFAPASGKLGNLARSTVGTETAAKRAVVAAGDTVDKGRSLFKSLALKSPSYHSTNYVNDMLWRAMAGEKNALANNARAAELLAGAGTDADKATMRALQEAGLPIEPGSHRFDLDPSKGLAQDLQSMIQPESAARDIYRAVAPAELGGTARSRGFGEMMEARQKLGHALFWMDQGATPEEAVAKTFSTLLDYQSRDALERGLAYAAPFSAFMSKAPRRAARFLLAKPGAAMSLDRTLRSFDDNTSFEPRESTMNQGPALRVGGVTRDAINGWMKVLANAYNRLGPGERTGPAEGVPQGLTTILQPKIDLYDAFSPLRSWDNLGMSAQPDIKAALEILTNRDLVAQRDFDGASLSVPQGSGLGQLGFPVANKDENPALARYAAPYLFDRGTMMLMNQWLGMQQPAGPAATLGAARYFQPDMDRRNVYAQQLMSYLFPFRVQIDDPVSGIANAMNSAEVRKAMKNEQEAKSRDKQYLLR